MLQAPGIPIFIDSRASTLYDDDLAADYFNMLDAAESWREKVEALRKIRLRSPFIADELRDDVQTRIRLLECSPVRYTPVDRGSAP